MAEQHSLAVKVLEGVFCNLYKAGMPFPVSMHLQDLKLHLGKAVWTAKQSRTGFSVSFF